MVVALVGGTAMASLAGAANRATTIVTIHGPEGDFHGWVQSERKGCLGGRSFKRGDFYAKVTRTHACKPDYTKTISL